MQRSIIRIENTDLDSLEKNKQELAMLKMSCLNLEQELTQLKYANDTLDRNKSSLYNYKALVKNQSASLATLRQTFLRCESMLEEAPETIVADIRARLYKSEADFNYSQEQADNLERIVRLKEELLASYKKMTLLRKTIATKEAENCQDSKKSSLDSSLTTFSRKHSRSTEPCEPTPKPTRPRIEVPKFANIVRQFRFVETMNKSQITRTPQARQSSSQEESALKEFSNIINSSCFNPGRK